MERRYLDISWTSLWRVVIMLVLVAFVYQAKNIFAALLLSIVISSALDPIVSFLERKKIPRILGSLSIFLIALGILSLLLYIVIPVVLSELSVLINSLGDIQPSLFGLKEASNIISNVSESIGKLTNILFSGSASVSDLVTKFLGSLTLTFSVFMLSLYLTIDRDGVEKFLKAILPPKSEDKVLEIYSRTRYQIGKWLQGQIFLSLSIGVAVSIGLWFLGIKYSLVLGILAGMLEIVPFVGPILSGGVAVLIAFSQSLPLAIYTFILFIVVQQMENHILVPVFMRLTTSLHPVVILVSVLIGAELFGIVGSILAVPAAVLVQEIVNNWTDIKRKRREMTS